MEGSNKIEFPEASMEWLQNRTVRTGYHVAAFTRLNGNAMANTDPCPSWLIT